MIEFEAYLLKQDLSRSTINAYVIAVTFFLNNYTEVSKKNLQAYKGYLVDNYKPKTVNLRIQGINKYLMFIKKENLKLGFIKLQQKTYLDNVISDADYEFLKKSLLKDNNLKWYFVVHYLGSTGARVSELIKIKIEDVNRGFIDIYGKGGKMRRIYIPLALQIKTQEWLKESMRSSGYLFTNFEGKQITCRGIAQQLKNIAKKYGVNDKVVYPHSFRHRFAKNFLAKFNDIALLADLMGHESIETTRIYLRRTSTEQQEIVNKVITW